MSCLLARGEHRPIVTGSNSRVQRNTHSRWCREQASSLALSGAPVCGMRGLPKGSRRATGRVSWGRRVCGGLFFTLWVVVRCGRSAGCVRSGPYRLLCLGEGVGLYKILFYCEAFVHKSIIRLLPPSTCIARTIAILLHVYSAVYDAPPTPLLYAIHHTVLAMAISCKDQGGELPCGGKHILVYCSLALALALGQA